MGEVSCRIAGPAPEAAMTGSYFVARACLLAGTIAVEATRARTFGRHSHDTYGFGVIDGGAQRSSSGRGPVEAGAGDVITVNPGEVHDGAPIGDGPRTWRMLYAEPGVLAG